MGVEGSSAALNPHPSSFRPEARSRGGKLKSNDKLTYHFRRIYHEFEYFEDMGQGSHRLSRIPYGGS